MHRVLKFAKFLHQFGWQPVILTVKNGSYPAIDNSLQNEIPGECIEYKTDAFEPFEIYKKFVGMKSGEKIPDSVLTEEKLSWKKKLSNWIRVNIFIPDARIGWLPFAVKEGKKIIKEQMPEMIFSTSPPPTVHLIAEKLAKWSKLPWTADFRDPWTNIFYYEKTSKSALAGYLDAKLENKVLKRADRITVVSNGFFGSNSKVIESKIDRIPNGFDSSDAEFTANSEVKGNDVFTIRYMGSLKPRQYVDPFFNVLAELSRQNEFQNQIKLEFIGYVDPTVKDKIEEKQIDFSIEYRGYLDHSKAINLISRSDLLLLIIGKSKSAKLIIASKMFEYMMVQKPILAYGPTNGEAARILSETNCGEMFDYEDEKNTKDFLIKNFYNWKNGNSNIDINLENWKQYERKKLTEKLVNIWEEIR